MTSFGPFRLDAANYRLYDGSTETRLTPKAAAILELLVTRPDELVTHNDLLEAVWRGVHVQPEVLKVYIAELRRALRDSADKPRYIETVHRRGYRFIRPSNGSYAPDSRHVGSERLVGRNREIALLNKLMKKAGEGHRQVAFITGETGIGKTALLNDFIHRIQRRTGVCAVLGQVARARDGTEPFSPILDAVARLLEGETREALIAGFRECGPGWLVQFPSLLDRGEFDRLGTELAGATSQRMIREFAEVIESCYQHTLLVLGLDDIHRADSSTLDLLQFLASRNRPAKLLIVAAADSLADTNRARSLIAPLHARRLSEEIKLRVLSRDNVKRFLEVQYPPSTVGSILAGPLHELSGGVPLFLCAAANYLEAKKWILKTEHGWIPCTETIRLNELFPPTLKELVEIRVSGLSKEDQRLLEAASISGSEFAARFVALALDEPAASVEGACVEIVKEGGWLQSTGFERLPDGGVSPKFRFLHELLREVLYCRQSPIERVRRHKRVAIALEKAVSEGRNASAHELALHFGAGHECSKSIQYLRAAARDSQRRYAGAEAAALLTQALKLSVHLPRSARAASELEMLNELGAAYFVAGDFGQASLSWHEALIKAIKQGRADIAVNALSWLAFPVGWDNPARLRKTSNLVLAHVQDIEDPILRSEITIRALALCEIAGASPADHSTTAAHALQSVLECGDRVRIASARIASAGLRLRSSEYEAVIADLNESLPIALEHNVMDVVRAEWSLSWALLHAGQWGRMQSVAIAAAEHARKNGNGRIQALFLTQLAWLHTECGSGESAGRLCRQVLDVSGNPVRGVGVNMCHVIAGMAALERGDHASTLGYIERASKTHLPAEHFWRVLAEITAVRAHLMRRDYSEAQRGADRLLQISANLTEKSWRAVALSVCAQASAANKYNDLARQHCGAALKIVDSYDLPLAKWRVQAVASEILSDPESSRLKEHSKQSRAILFNSLGDQDPLRPLPDN